MSVSDIEGLLKPKEDYKITLRLFSILPIAKGESSRKAQKLLLLSHNQICIWVKRFNEFGLEGLNDSPTHYGFNTGTWTAPLLVKVVEKHCNITYSDDMIYVLLKKKLGLTHKKGKGFYAEAKPEVREKFVEDLKKLYECPVEDVFLFEDECSMSNTADVSYKWSEKGKQPLIEQKQYKREGLTFLGL
jgi:transposase